MLNKIIIVEEVKEKIPSNPDLDKIQAQSEFIGDLLCHYSQECMAEFAFFYKAWLSNLRVYASISGKKHAHERQRDL